MGSKKHKKESKKKKHRSRSRSPLDNEERERKRHKKHKDRKKDRSPDVEEVPVDSHLQKTDNGVERVVERSSSSSEPEREKERERERDRRLRAHREDGEGHSYERDVERERTRDREREVERERPRERERERAHERERVHEREKPQERARDKSPENAAGGGAQESLSIEETNRLRAKLGLKPLEVNEPPAEDGKIKDDLGEFYHKPAANIAQQKKSEKIRERLEQRKEKRKIEQKLQITTLGEGSDDEDASAWVQKSREIQKQKQEAAKRAALLDEMDAVFGVSALLDEGGRPRRYDAAALRGLRVAHDIHAIADERETILTLADKPVLAEDDEDVLVNVNIVDDEKYKKNLEERKKARAGYQAYDDEAELEAAALGMRRPVLAKYDDELRRGTDDKSRGFLIGDDDALDAQRFRDIMRQERLQGGPDKRLESLRMPELRVASEYLDEREIETKFKKPKKKGKMRKKAKEEPIDVDDYDAGTGPLLTDDTDVKPSSLAAPLAVDEEEVEPDSELQAALARARRLRQAERAAHVPKVEDILERVKEEPGAAEEPDTGDGMVLDATAEFCRTLGDIPTYGLAGNRHHHAEILDFEQEMETEEPESESNAGAWSRVDVGSEKPPDLTAGSSVGLEAEPAPRHVLNHLLTARHYSIEDKTAAGEDDKYGRRERGGHSGPLVEFREKASFRPNIKLEYVDDDGRPLCPKEAFRYLSHKFHGKGPGKNKQEKRIKKAVQEGLMKKMSSTDTPLGTLQMLQEKQRETHSPYIVLSGTKREPNT
ncbi:U4/U6.U5 tri-snRNP-associated protein 1 isoform X2 [Pectinophora gossypiella]|uniref:U4/U6.U5 tri-snRNP-associated protein 1 isoform X2 n=1 Tax=Pectinophora gossypiella TaxID=13191 RepID=UPI00214EC5CF|nr:U4/U6.U5 tri-snRNP-associated protein 1 isoform X2 [Pectinophora gossypiella]